MNREVVNNSKLEKKMKIELFDFNKDWNLVKPHLNDPEVLDALDESMISFSMDYKEPHVPVWDRSNNIGPWDYTTSLYWDFQACDEFDESPEAQDLYEKYSRLFIKAGYDPEDVLYQDEDPEMTEKCKKLLDAYYQEEVELKEQFYPKPGTFQWYQCFHSGHYYVHFERALAEKVLPEYQWEIFADYGESNGTGYAGFSGVVGINDDGDIMVFDLLHFESMTANEILEKVGFGFTEKTFFLLKEPCEVFQLEEYRQRKESTGKKGINKDAC
jgi:hypothetical protein